ncbi:MAG: hypothetical protein ACQEW9_14305 [Bacteroidota bacterium]|uniref:Uncharacterized protein n=1 Tax=Algoriphagus faecimaris TaxID=686796 RepID=A0A1G6XMU1_9BACT|nr:hypothetical protein [Algoriphagus faecimaris]SDD79073.1 hypothetical protein SAMN04488104_10621 [Algoriphagus faecimaris]
MRYSLLLFFVIFLYSCGKKEVTVITFPDELELINTNGSPAEPCLTCEKMLVTYFGMNETRPLSMFRSMLIKRFEDLKTKHPELPVILIFGGENKELGLNKTYLEDLLSENQFPYSVFYDKENKFFGLNHLEYFPYERNDVQMYLVKEGQVFSSAEMGIPELFEKQVQDFLQP